MAVLFGETLVHSGDPLVYAKADYTSSRSGNTQFYTVTLSMRCGGAYSWYNSPWIVRMWINGVEVSHNWVIKGQTNGQLGTRWFTQTTTVSVDIGNFPSGNVSFSINYYELSGNYAYGTIDSNGRKLIPGNTSGSVLVNPLPIMSLAYSSKTSNSITFTYNYSNIAPSNIRLYNGSTYLGEFYSSPFTVTRLSPKTTYSDLKIFGYANGGYGAQSNTLSITTYPADVSVKSVTVNEIQPFSCQVNVTSSSKEDTSLVEYAIIDMDGKVIKQPVTSSSYSHIFDGLNEETTYQARVRVQTVGSENWSEYSYVTFTTLADQASSWITVNGKVVKGKMFYKESEIWYQVKKIYAKDNTNWKPNVNN